MQVFILDGSQFTNQEVFHEIVSQQLDFPDYYGKNLDALWDCLTEVDLPMKLVWRNFSDSQKFLNEYADKAAKVFTNAQEELAGFSFYLYLNESARGDRDKKTNANKVG